MKQLIIAIRVTIVFTVLTGVLYPALVTGLASTLFPHEASGSLVTAGSRVTGSELIGQRFTHPEYFHGRPSAAGNDGYDATSSGGSNYGPTSQKLIDRVKDDAKKFRAENPGFTGPLPADAVTASASGLDPHISPGTAEAQVDRIAAARSRNVSEVRAILSKYTESRQFGLLGEPRVNVLMVNLALDRDLPLKR